MEVGSKMMQCEARVLPTPTLLYQDRFPINDAGSWNLRNAKLRQGAVITSWGVICLCKVDMNVLKDSVTALGEVSSASSAAQFRITFSYYKITYS